VTSGQRLTPLEMLARLVSFDTESAKSNLALIDFVEDYLKSWNVPYVRVPNAAATKRRSMRPWDRRSLAAWCSPGTRTWSR
jgi:acetylornithine deacetylase/succinyl-diaminopimelate desuccinylase-like protein